MQIIPAIDLRGGRVVRLFQGKQDKEKVYFENPAEVAGDFCRQGAKRLHIVNLDGAFGDDDKITRDAIFAIRAKTDVVLDVGGGIRRFETAKEYIEKGIDKIVLGSVFFDNIQQFGEILSLFADKVVLSADVENKSVKIHGWREGSGAGLEDFFNSLKTRLVREVIVTSIVKDGTLAGIDPEFYSGIVGMTDIPVIASGGVKGLQDLEALASTGVAGVIIGKAVYENKMDLREAIEKYGSD
ncbi:MAG: 1-(5-phosphoribosyl)-5-[(5-phosphoribosylamino)methylideneamino] imidazole-4-carboxamide isomerase [bacterium]